MSVLHKQSSEARLESTQNELTNIMCCFDMFCSFDTGSLTLMVPSLADSIYLLHYGNESNHD